MGPRPVIAWVGWALLAAALVSLCTGAAAGRVSRPGPLLAAALSRPAVRLGLGLCWMWIGWYLFAR
jgi:hypothetical protein